MNPPPAPNAVLAGRTDLTPDLAIFRIVPDTPAPPGETWFQAGQHVEIFVEGTDLGTSGRPFSVASPPEDHGAIELCIRRGVGDDRFLDVLWSMSAGARIAVGRRFEGHLTLERTVAVNDGRWKVFAAAGTGIAPFASMLRSLARRAPDRDPGRVVLLQAAHAPEELAYADEMERLLNGGAGRRRYFPSVSGDDPGWAGARGRVETFFDDARMGVLEAALSLGARGFNPVGVVVYVCGHRGTIAGTIHRLLRHGFVPDDRTARVVLGIPQGPQSSLFFEYYDPEPLVDPFDLDALQRLRAEFPRWLVG